MRGDDEEEDGGGGSDDDEAVTLSPVLCPRAVQSDEDIELLR